MEKHIGKTEKKRLKEEILASKKPKVRLSGKNGNVFNLAAICSTALKKVGQADKAKEMQGRILSAKSYEDALRIMAEYCEVS